MTVFSAWRTVGYAVLWQGAWFATVLGAAKGWPWIGLLAVVPPLLLAGWGRWRRALAVAAVAFVLGLAVDGVLGLSGAARYPGGLLDGRLSPPWMWCLWVELGLALDLCLAWLRPRPWLALAFGAIGGPLAYLSGVRLGAMIAPAGELTCGLAVGVAYAIALPILILLTPWPRSSNSSSSA